MTSTSENEINIDSNFFLLSPTFGWNLEDFSRNLSEKEALTEKKSSNYLGNNNCF